ncbi:MAG TPA: nucleoside recognition domain-containing protein [Tepidisphaeraceae bacterium]|jgi:spore maturation protein A
MLNYIWAALIVFSLVFALVKDVKDIRNDTYRNGSALPVQITFDSADDAAKPTRPVHIAIDPQTYATFYKTTDPPAASYAGTITTTAKGLGAEVRFAADAPLPKLLAKIRDSTTPEDDRRLVAEVAHLQQVNGTTSTAGLKFQPVRFQTMADIANAAVAAAKAAVTLALGLIGVIGMWLGLTRIGEKAGLIAIFNKIVQPILRPLFPEVPGDHPAMGFMALNLTANILGMGNAATPMGLKAMEELQTLNPVKDTATNSMVMLLAMHASSIQLLPPVMVIAVMGLRATNELLMPIWICSAFGLVMGIIAAKVFGLFPGYRRTDPNVIARERPIPPAPAIEEAQS